MIDLNDVAIFVRVVEARSFTGAARSLRVPNTTVSRRVRKLEDRLGVRLLHRTTRSLNLTDAGRSYYEACSRSLSDIEDADQLVSETQTVPTGTIRISAPADFGGSFFVDVIADFLAQHPRVKAEVLLTDEQLNLIEARVDVALRASQLTDSTLVARKLGPTRRLFCASPAYIAARGEPRILDDLKNHDCIIFAGSVTGATWTVDGKDGTETISVNGRIAANTMLFALRAAVAGLGIAQLPEAIATRQIQAGRLITTLGQYSRERGGLYLVYPDRRHLSAATKAIIEHLARRFISGTEDPFTDRSSRRTRQ